MLIDSALFFKGGNQAIEIINLYNDSYAVYHCVWI